jgi:type I restriction enzyme M protein
MTPYNDIVQKIWNLCHILRGDGVSYHQYISELTYLLLLKIAETNETDQLIPAGYRWTDLVNYSGDDLLTHYRDILTLLGGHAEDRRVREIYAFPTTVFSHSENLRAVIEDVNRLDWLSISSNMMGDIYGGLIAKNSQDSRSGAGQYFTPRVLIDSIVRLVKPKPGEHIQDPAAGSGGFLVAANAFIKENGDGRLYERNPPTFEGMEIEKGTYRICLMNSFLHDLDLRLLLGDALTADAEDLRSANVILANPSFGARAGGARRQRRDLPFPTANKQLAFLQASSRCDAKSARGLMDTNFHAAATTSRHVLMAVARRTRCDGVETRWRWTLKVLYTAACVDRNFCADRALLKRCILRSRRRVG